jgi:hypothetical protein
MEEMHITDAVWAVLIIALEELVVVDGYIIIYLPYNDFIGMVVVETVVNRISLEEVVVREVLYLYLQIFGQLV